MDLTKDEARQMLTNKIIWDEKMPIWEEVIYNINTSKNTIKEYTFRGLIKYIYELKDIK